MRTIRTTLFLLLCVSVCASGQVLAQSTAPSTSGSDYDPSLVVAKIADSQYTLGDLRALVELRYIYRSTPQEDAQRRKELFEGFIDEKLIEAEARTVGMKGRHGAIARARKSAVTFAANIFMVEAILPQIKIDSATIDTFYNNHISRYSSPEDQRRARIISVWKEGHRPAGITNPVEDSVYRGWYPEDKVDSLYTRLSEGEDFTLLVAHHSEDGFSRSRLGDLGWVSATSLGGGRFGELAMSQPLHMISKPIETDVSWHILQITDERPAGPVPLNDEIRRDIVENLREQQRAKLVQELNDSLLAVAKIEWNEESMMLPHDQLRREMALVVVNKRDTVYVDEYFLDLEKWLERGTNAPPDPDRRRNILRENYVRFVSWLEFLREKGYMARPEAVNEFDRVLQFERAALVHARIESERIPEPDSAMIQKYYKDSVHLFGSGPGALQMSWNSIKAKLKSEARATAFARWRKSAAARFNLVRYDDRLAKLPLLEHVEKKS